MGRADKLVTTDLDGKDKKASPVSDYRQCTSHEDSFVLYYHMGGSMKPRAK